MSNHEQFDDAFRRWASRPTSTGAPDAARAVLSRMSPAEGTRRTARARRLSPAWATLAIAVVGLAAGTASFIRSLPPAVQPRPAVAVPATPVPAREADVVLWLDDGTPVYVFLPDGK